MYIIKVLYVGYVLYVMHVMLFRCMVCMFCMLCIAMYGLCVCDYFSVYFGTSWYVVVCFVLKFNVS